MQPDTPATIYGPVRKLAKQRNGWAIQVEDEEHGLLWAQAGAESPAARPVGKGPRGEGLRAGTYIEGHGTWRAHSGRPYVSLDTLVYPRDRERSKGAAMQQMSHLIGEYGAMAKMRADYKRLAKEAGLDPVAFYDKVAGQRRPSSGAPSQDDGVQDMYTDTQETTQEAEQGAEATPAPVEGQTAVSGPQRGKGVGEKTVALPSPIQMPAIPGIEWTNTSAAAGAGLNILVYGEPGVGKTHLAGTTGEPERTLYVSAEGGALTLRHEGLTMAKVGSFDALRGLYVWLRKGDHPFRWVIIDSISEVAEVCLRAELDKPAKSGEQRHGMQAYGATLDAITGLVRAWRDLPLHVVMTAKMEYNEDAAMFMPMMPGRKLSQGLAYHFDEVFLACAQRDPEDPKRVTRWLQTYADGKRYGKDRSGVLDPQERPSLKTIAGKILGTTKEQ